MDNTVERHSESAVELRKQRPAQSEGGPSAGLLSSWPARHHTNGGAPSACSAAWRGSCARRRACAEADEEGRRAAGGRRAQTRTAARRER